MFCRLVFFFQAEDGIRDLVRSRGLGDVYKRQDFGFLKGTRSLLTLLAVLLALGVHGGLAVRDYFFVWGPSAAAFEAFDGHETDTARWLLSLIHISEPTRPY